ncbi:MAG: 50S ribosomal protein L15 [Solirubrobacterales bacterium]
MAEEKELIGTHNLKPAPAQSKDRKRVGRGHGSGTGKTSGRGHKGQGSRSGGKPGPAYEGGQTPIHMRMRKLRGPTKKTSMPFEPFRTQTQPVNVDDLERLFKAGDTVDAETLAAKGLATRKGVPVKILGRGEIKIKLDVTAAKFSAEAQRKIEAAGGSCKVLGA